MVSRCRNGIIVSLLACVVILAGCAKRPALTTVSAPPPSGAAQSQSSPPPGGPSTSASPEQGQGQGGQGQGQTPGQADSQAGAAAGSQAQAPGSTSGAGSSSGAGGSSGAGSSSGAADSSGAAGSSSAAGSTTTTASATPPRPPAQEFTANPNLKDIGFDFDKYDIRQSDAKILDANATWLKTNDVLVLIEGHCDERGTNEYNLVLGERRAKSTMNYLVSQGVQAGRITIISYGEERSVCTEHTEACWGMNRRAHFLSKPR